MNSTALDSLKRLAKRHVWQAQLMLASKSNRQLYKLADSLDSSIKSDDVDGIIDGLHKLKTEMVAHNEYR